jgi:hypothetical protein
MEKEEFVEKAKEMATESLQKLMPEAVASVTYELLSPDGYPILLTMRDGRESALFERMEALEKFFKDSGYQPNIKSRYTGRTEAQKEYVEGRKCPKCGEPLIYFESKGKKHIKCSTSKWDYMTKKATGCDYIEWSDDLDSSTGKDYSGSGATPAQMRLLKEKNLWEEGMTKARATELIGKVLGK